MINANGVTQFFKANAPAILTASACVGTVATAILTAKSTTLAVEKIADYCEANLRSPEDLSWKEKFAVSYRVYIPPGHRRRMHSGIDHRGESYSVLSWSGVRTGLHRFGGGV